MTTYIPSLTLPTAFFTQPAIAILLPLVSGSGVGYLVGQAATKKTYLDLKQPWFRPPAWVFGPAWTVLYTLMGYGAYRSWTVGHASFDPAKSDLAKHGATVYTIQLALNLVFMPLFFTLKEPIPASVDIVALTGTVGYLAYIWSKVDPVAAWCIAPYFGWLSFASTVCISCGYLNDWDFKGKEKPVSDKPKGKAS